MQRGDTALWVEGLGHADAARRRAVDPEETLFRVCAYLSSAADMALFGVALFDGTLLTPPSAQLLLGGGDTYRAQGVGAGGTAFLLSHAPSGTSLVLLGNVSGETLGPALQAAFGVMGDLFLGDVGPAG